MALCPDQECIFLGSDGNLDLLDNQSIRELVQGYSQNPEIAFHFCLAEVVNAVIKGAMWRESTDNFSVDTFALKPFLRGEITVRRLPSEIREMPSSVCPLKDKINRSVVSEKNNSC